MAPDAKAAELERLQRNDSLVDAYKERLAIDSTTIRQLKVDKHLLYVALNEVAHCLTESDIERLRKEAPYFENEDTLHRLLDAIALAASRAETFTP